MLCEFVSAFVFFDFAFVFVVLPSYDVSYVELE